jgi:hypothetical protein
MVRGRNHPLIRYGPTPCGDGGGAPCAVRSPADTRQKTGFRQPEILKSAVHGQSFQDKKGSKLPAKNPASGDIISVYQSKQRYATTKAPEVQKVHNGTYS